MKQYLTVVLICLSLMVNEVEHLFMCLLDISISFFVENSYSESVFSSQFIYVVLVIALSNSYKFLIQVFYQIHALQLSFPFCGSHFHFLDGIPFEVQKLLIFYEFQHIYTYMYICICMDFPGGSDGKAFVYNAGDLGLISGSGRFPGEGNGNPLQYSCLENPMDGGAWCRLLSMFFFCCLCFLVSYPRMLCLTQNHKGFLLSSLQFQFLSLGLNCCCLVTKLCLTICDPVDCSLAVSSVHFLGKNTGVGCHFLLQGIFSTQGSNPCLLQWQADSSPLSHQGSPGMKYFELIFVYDMRKEFSFGI